MAPAVFATPNPYPLAAHPHRSSFTPTPHPNNAPLQQGHKGELVFGLLSGVPAMCLRGRFHSYEGYSMDLCALPVRVMRCLGVKVAIITNAAGGLNPENNVGDVVCITDHFALPNMAGKNCLVGHNDAELGEGEK